MALLSFSTNISELRKKETGKETVRQTLDITVDYNPDDDTFNVLFCLITQGGISLEVTKLLDEAPGKPLDAILETINWQEIYSDYLLHEIDREVEFINRKKKA